MDLYRDIILDHYKHPRNFGSLEKPDKTAESYNATCGDKIKMEIRVVGSKSEAKISDIRFSGVGCAISQAAASMLTEKIKNMPIDQVINITAQEIIDMLGVELTPSRVKCATLPLEVIKKALIQ
jgi:nitrogen fixation protein NifU and related proteins